MRTCIYFDVEEVTQAHLATGAQRAGDAAHLFSTAMAAPIHGYPSTMEWFPSHRDEHYLDRLMTWIDHVIHLLQANGTWWQRRGCSWLEVLRYRLLATISPWEHRAHVLGMLRSRGYQHVLWITDTASQHAMHRLHMLDALARQHGMHMDLFNTHQIKAPSALQTASDNIKSTLKHYRHMLRLVCKQSSMWPKPAPILSLDYFPNSVKAILPVLQQLQTQHNVATTWIAGRRLVSDALQTHGIHAPDLHDLVSIGTMARGRLTRAELRGCDRACDALPMHVWQNTDTITPSPFSVQSYLEPLMRQALHALGHEAVQWLEMLHEMMNRLRPAVVVSTTYSSIPGKAAALMAQRHGIQSVYVQHGIISPQRAWWHFSNTHMLMWGAYERNQLIAHGHNPKTITVTGSTLYDRLLTRIRAASPNVSPADLRHTKDHAYEGSSLRVIYFAPRSGGAVLSTAASIRACHMVIAAMQTFSNVTLTLKLHPADHTDHLKALSAPYPFCHVVQATHSHDLLLQHDIVITCASTTGYEACVAYKPLIILKVHDETIARHYEEHGAALIASSAQEIATHITTIMHQPGVRQQLHRAQQRFQDSRLHGMQGNACALAAAAILQTAALHPKEHPLSQPHHAIPKVG